VTPGRSFSRADRVGGFRLLPRDQAEELFLALGDREHAELLEDLPPRRGALVDSPPASRRRGRLPPEADPAGASSSPPCWTRQPGPRYARAARLRRGRAGGLMSPRFARCARQCGWTRRELSAPSDEGSAETIYYVYVLDQEQRLCSACLFPGTPHRRATAGPRIMTPTSQHPGGMDQEAGQRGLCRDRLSGTAGPSIRQGRIRAIVTSTTSSTCQERSPRTFTRWRASRRWGDPTRDSACWRWVRKRALLAVCS